MSFRNHPEDIADDVLLTSRLHNNIVNYCSLAYNSSLAVSCSIDGMVKVIKCFATIYLMFDKKKNLQ